MNLQQLVEIGSVREGFEPVEVTWHNGDEEVSFNILAKREMTAADHEFIFLGAGRKRDEEGKMIEDDHDAYVARRIHRMVRLDNEGVAEVIPYETAKHFKGSLLIAMAQALNSVEKQPDADESKKKPKPSKKKSGMSSSSTGSADEQ